jgi:hypothetical protein
MEKPDTIDLIVLLDLVEGADAAAALYLSAGTLTPEKFGKLVQIIKDTHPEYAQNPSDVSGHGLLGQYIERPSAKVAGVYASFIQTGLTTATQVAHDIQDIADAHGINMQVLTPASDLTKLPDWARHAYPIA